MARKRIDLGGNAPKDRTLAEFKAWIMGMMEKIKPGYLDQWSESECESKWREFWEKRDKAKRTQ